MSRGGFGELERGWILSPLACARVRLEDDGSFYDGSGAYRGQVEDGGLVWEEGNGYTGFHEDNHFSEEGHYGVPDIYEDGGDGTGGAFDSLMAGENDDEDR